MCRPIPSFGIPTLDPYKNDTIPFYLTEKRFGHLEGTIWKLKISNLSDFVINKVDLSLTLKLDLNITVPEIHLSSVYRVKGIISSLFPIDGAGFLKMPFGIFFYESNADKEYFCYYIKPKVGGLSGTLDRITSSDEVNRFFDKYINQKGSELVDHIWYDYENETIQFILDLSKEIMKDINVQDIVGSISGGGSLFPDTDPPATCKITSS